MKDNKSKEVLTSVAKSLFSSIPYAGTALTELVFDYNGRIKQNRLNHFTEILAEGFIQNSDINIENIKTEHFNDLFEAIIKRVVTTKSEAKLNRFKNILINELKSPSESDVVDIYLDLINNLSENEIFILYNHRHFDKSYLEEKSRRNTLSENLEKALDNKKKETIVIGESKYNIQIQEIEKERQLIFDKHEKLKIYRNPEFFNLDETKYFFYIQRLYSQALLIDSGIGSIGAKPFYVMSITEFGVSFLKFLKEFEN